MSSGGATEATPAFQHHDVVEPQHRFQAIKFHDETWDLRHLDAFALRLDPDLGFEIDVVVLFTCHCFAHSMKWDERASTEIPPEEIFDNGTERRVLDKERYELSRRFMPQLVKELDQRQIRFAGVDATNFFIAEDLGPESGPYAVFFEVKRDRRRKKANAALRAICLIRTVERTTATKRWPSHASLSIAFPRTPTPRGAQQAGWRCLLHSLVAGLHESA